MKKLTILIGLFLFLVAPLFAQQSQVIANKILKLQGKAQHKNLSLLNKLNQNQLKSSDSLPYIDSVVKLDLWDTLGGIWVRDWSGNIQLNSNGKLHQIIGFCDDGFSDYKEEHFYNSDGTIAEILESIKDDPADNWREDWVYKWKYDANQNPIKFEEYSWDNDSAGLARENFYYYYYTNNELDSFIEWGKNYEYVQSINSWVPFWVKRSKVHFYKTGNTIDSVLYEEGEYFKDTLLSWGVEEKYIIDFDPNGNMTEFIALEYVGDSAGIRLFEPYGKETYAYNIYNQCTYKAIYEFDEDSLNDFYPVYDFECTYENGNPIQYIDNNIEEGVQVWNRILDFKYDSSFLFSDVNAYYYAWILDAGSKVVFPTDDDEIIPDLTRLSWAPIGIDQDEENDIDFKIVLYYSNGIVKVIESKKTSFKIFPNPSQGIFFIDGAANGELVEVYNLEGKRVFNTSNNSGKIDLSSLNKGLYLLKVGDSGFKKVILE